MAESKIIIDVNIRSNADNSAVKKTTSDFKELTSRINSASKAMGVLSKTVSSTATAYGKLAKVAGKAAFTGVSKILGGIGKSMTGYLSTLTKVSGLLSVVLIPAISKGIDAYSDLSEAMNVTNETFKENSTAVHKWASENASAFGLSLYQTEKYVSTFAGLFKGRGIDNEQFTIMSENLTALTGDMASFYNLKPEEAFEKLKSGINGSAESLTSVGIAMTEASLEEYRLSEGIEKSVKDMNEAEKAMLRYNFIISKTADVQGDFNRTADFSWSNQIKLATTNLQDLLTVIGEYFQTRLLPILKGFNSVISSITVSIVNLTGFDLSNLYADESNVAEQAEGYEAEAEAIEDVGVASKKAASNLQGFDALNNLTVDTEDISDTADALDDISMTAKSPYTFGNKKEIKSFREYWEAFWGADFVSYGKKVSTLIDNFSGKILDFWDKLSDLDIGYKVAEFFNGLMSKDWKGVGELITSPIRFLIEEFNKFTSKFSFSKFGDKIKETLLGAIDNLWGSSDSSDKPGQLAGENIANLINGLSEMIISAFGDEEVVNDFTEGFSNMLHYAIENLDEDKLGEALSDIMKNLGNLMRNLTTSKDMKKLGTKLGEALNEGIEDGSAGDLLGGFLDLVLDIIDGVAAFIETVDWFDLAGSLLTAIHDAIKDHPDAANLIGTALKAILAWELLKTIVSVALTSLGEKIIGGIAGAFTTKISTDALATGLSGALGTVKNGLKAGTALFAGADMLGLSLGAIIAAGAVVGIKAGIEQIIDYVNKVKQDLANAKSAISYAQGLSDMEATDALIVNELSGYDSSKMTQAAMNTNIMIDKYSKAVESGYSLLTGSSISKSEYYDLRDSYGSYVTKLSEILGDSATSDLQAKYKEFSESISGNYWDTNWTDAFTKLTYLVSEIEVLQNSAAAAYTNAREREDAIKELARSNSPAHNAQYSNEYMLNIGLTMGTTAQSQAYTNASNLRLKMLGAN